MGNPKTFVRTKTGNEKREREAFMRIRVEEFAKLWKAFAAVPPEKLDFYDEYVNQVINGLPIESLNDWKRSRK
jgi:hypothetical protein